MRVRSTTTPVTTGTVQTPASNAVRSGAGIFTRHLIQQEDSMEKYNEEVNALRKEIEEFGDKLTEEPTLPNFTRFRDALSRLAKRVSNEAYRLEKFGGSPQQPRYYEIITVINQEADRLYRMILHEQQDNLAITARVIGIKGMVVDLIT